MKPKRMNMRMKMIENRMKLVGITLLVLTIMIPTTIYDSDDDEEEDFNIFLKLFLYY